MTNINIKKIISKNRPASFNYFIEDRAEAGIVLKGSEVKSIRLGKINIEDSYIDLIGNELFFLNMHIALYDNATKFATHSTREPRKVLLHKKEIKKFIGKIKQKGYSLIPLSMYFNKKNIIKLEIGLGKGKKLHDKRESLKEKDWNREQSRIIRNK